MNAPTDIQREHDSLSELLPLAVGGALSEGQRLQLDAHLAQCDTCRTELALLRNVQAQLAARDVAAASPDAEARSIARVLARMQAERSRAAAAPRWHGWLQAWTQWPAPARWLVAGQAALVAVLMLLLVPVWLAQLVGPGFETAAGPSTPAAAGARARVAWRNDASAAALRELLTALNADVVAGPSAAGFYTIEFGRGAPPDALARLRARNDLVQWAEPL
jgi:anti-sigma factor RsiW